VASNSKTDLPGVSMAVGVRMAWLQTAKLTFKVIQWLWELEWRGFKQQN